VHARIVQLAIGGKPLVRHGAKARKEQAADKVFCGAFLERDDCVHGDPEGMHSFKGIDQKRSGKATAVR